MPRPELSREEAQDKLNRLQDLSPKEMAEIISRHRPMAASPHGPVKRLRANTKKVLEVLLAEQ